jgi:hypothetical protein
MLSLPCATHETFFVFLRLISEAHDKLMRPGNLIMLNVNKKPPLVEDLHNHSPELMAELRLLLSSGAPSRPDPRRPGFFEVEGLANTFYVFKYPTGTKVLLLGVWTRESDPVAELVACSCPAA